MVAKQQGMKGLDQTTRLAIQCNPEDLELGWVKITYFTNSGMDWIAIPIFRKVHTVGPSFIAVGGHSVGIGGPSMGGPL